MSDFTKWKEIEIPIRVISYTPGRAATFYDPAEPAEVEWEIDAPMAVREWLMEQLDNDDLEDIEADLIEQAKKNRRHIGSFAQAVEDELSHWDRLRREA